MEVLVTESCSTLRDPMDCQPARLFRPWNSPGKNTGAGSHSLLQGIFLTQESNPGLPHHRQIIYHLNSTQSETISFLRGSSCKLQQRRKKNMSCVAESLQPVLSHENSYLLDDSDHICQKLEEICLLVGLPSGTSDKEPACQCRRLKRHRFDSWVGKIPWRRAWQPSPVLLPGESHGQRSLAGYNLWGRKSQTRLSDSTTTTPVDLRQSINKEESPDFSG